MLAGDNGSEPESMPMLVLWLLLVDLIVLYN